MRQAHPDWTAIQIKTALTSTATPSIKKGLKAGTPFEQGAGMLNIPAALNAALTFSSASHAHGACVAICQFTKTLTNVSDQAQTVEISIQLENAQAMYTTCNAIKSQYPTSFSRSDLHH